MHMCNYRYVIYTVLRKASNVVYTCIFFTYALYVYA